MQFIMSVGNLMEEVWKVATESHLKGSKGSHSRTREDGSHSRTREDARENGVKRDESKQI